jgi:hypothetical protein
MHSILRAAGFPAVLFLLAVFSFSAFGQAGLTLGGKFVPKDSIMLFINMGNSAMTGRDKSPDLVTDPHLWKYEMNPTNYDLLPAAEPICVDARSSLAAPLGGPIMPLLKRLNVLYPNYYFIVMQLSNSAWKLQGNFNAGAANHNALMTRALILKPNVTIAGIISMLNIVEVEVKDTANYLQKVIDMVSHCRSDLGTLQYNCGGTMTTYTLPYIHAGYPVMAKSSAAAQYDTSLAQTKSIIRQIAQIPANIPTCVVIPTDSCPICTTCTPAGYYSHYDRAGNLRWGGRTADTIKARGWMPPASVTCVGISASQRQMLSSVRSPETQKIMFDGSNWSVFDKAGKSFSIYSPNGRAITSASAAALRKQKLLPGVYFVKLQWR